MRHVLVALLLCGCTCSQPIDAGARDGASLDPAASSGGRVAADPPPLAGAGARCRLGRAETIVEGRSRGHAVGIAVGETASMLVFDRDRSTLLAVAARPAFGARPVEVPIAGADELFALEALDGDRFVAITHTRCPEWVASTRCLIARLLGSDGRAIGDAVAIGLGGVLRTVRVLASGSALYVARSPARGAPALDRLVATDAGLEAGTARLGDGLELEDEPTEILGLAVSGGSWAVLWRHGAVEDARSGVVLSTPIDEREVEALHDVLVLESFQWHAGALSMVASFEFAPPQFVRLGADGDLLGTPRQVGAMLPAPFARRRTATILGRGAEAAIEVRDGAGERVALVPFATPTLLCADVARQDRSFLVAIARRQDDAVAIDVRPLHCDEDPETGGAGDAPR